MLKCMRVALRNREIRHVYVMPTQGNRGAEIYETARQVGRDMCPCTDDHGMTVSRGYGDKTSTYS